MEGTEKSGVSLKKGVIHKFRWYIMVAFCPFTRILGNQCLILRVQNTNSTQFLPQTISKLTCKLVAAKQQHIPVHWLR